MAQFPPEEIWRRLTASTVRRIFRQLQEADLLRDLDLPQEASVDYAIQRAVELGPGLTDPILANYPVQLAPAAAPAPAGAGAPGTGAAYPLAAEGAGGTAGAEPVEVVSLSSVVGGFFEGDASDALTNFIRGSCPFASAISSISSRDHLSLESDGPDCDPLKRQVDLFGYIGGPDERSLPCVSQPSVGVTVLYPRKGQTAPDAGCTAWPALLWAPSDIAAAGAEDKRFSARNLSPDMPQKYLIGEAYCGSKHASRMDKLKQLDTLLLHAYNRWRDMHPTYEVGDITQIVGVAALVFSASVGERTSLTKEFAEAAQQSFRSGARPQAYRMAQAGRLLLIFLCPNQQRVTTSFRMLIKIQTGKLAIQDDISAR